MLDYLVDCIDRNKQARVEMAETFSEQTVKEQTEAKLKYAQAKDSQGTGIIMEFSEKLLCYLEYFLPVLC